MSIEKKRLLVCACGTLDGGGTGFAHIVRCAQAGIIDADVVGSLSDNPSGGVREKADLLKVPFFHLTPQYSYRDALVECDADVVVFCGWRRDVYGLDPERTIALVRGSAGNETYFGTPTNAVAAFLSGANDPPPEIIVRFVTGPTVNDGPIIVRIPVEIRVEVRGGLDFQLPRPKGGNGEDEKRFPIFTGTPQKKLARITKFWMRAAQRNYFPQIINHVLLGQSADKLVRKNGVYWNGVSESSLHIPPSYGMLEKALTITTSTRA